MNIMSQKITLENTPNQTFDIILNEQECTISIYLKKELYYFDLISNGINIVSGVKINFGSVLLSYPYFETIFNGNFIIANENNNEVIDYNNFGTITNLYYVYEA